MGVLFPVEAPMAAGIREELMKQGLDLTEAACMRVLEDDRFDNSLKWKAAIGLRVCGTLHALPALKTAIDCPNEDVKLHAILTIADLAADSETGFLLGLLERKKLRKSHVLQALDAIDDPATVPVVTAYLAQTLKTDRRNSTLRAADISSGLFLLDRHRASFAETAAVLAGYQTIWHKFDALTQKALSTGTETFRGMYRFR